MPLNLLDRIQAKLEILRLEKRYTRRRDRRSTFVSNAIYVDGEYVYQTPNSTGSSSDSDYTTRQADRSAKRAQEAAAALAALEGELGAPQESERDNGTSTAERKKLNRFSSLPGFGSGSVGRSGDKTHVAKDWRSMQRASMVDMRRH